MEATKKMVLSPQEAADALGLCLNSIYKMLRRGQLKGVRVERKILVPKQEIERLLRLDGAR
ncbi:MAG: helix-turn-helix domain-containing protein [Dehalococcoidaceae bacterium]|nr:helix-turn-helix domain-containing protein [Dehalococcoidaceae bacterium]